MPSWSLRVSVLAVMLLAFAGCDPNPSGPAAPVTIPPNAGDSSKPGAKAQLPTNKNKTVEGPKPFLPD